MQKRMSSGAVDDGDAFFNTLRSISEDFTARGDERLSQNAYALLLPSVSNVSLWVVWFVSVVGTATCYLFCEVHQSSYPAFPLEFFSALGAQLVLVSCFLVFISGVHRHGRRVYHLYQPFAGGAQFVALQGIGAMCLALTLCVVAVHVTMFDVQHFVRGVYVYCAVLSLVGNTLLMCSIAWFDPHKVHSSTMSYLSRKPNAETILSMCLMVSQLVFGGVGTYLPSLVPNVTVLVLAIDLINGAIIHFIIGSRHTRGYRDCFSLTYISSATVQLWAAWLNYIVPTVANVFLALHPAKSSPAWLLTVVLAEIMAGGFLLLVVRFTKFGRNPSGASTPHATIAQYGGAAAVIASIVLACGEYFMSLRLHSLKDTTVPTVFTKAAKRHVESSNWTWGDLMQLGLFVSKSLSSLLPILTQIGGRVVHGSRFMWFNGPIGRQYRSFVLLQVAGWWFFIVSCGFFGLFVLTDASAFGAVTSLTNVFSVACLTFSIQEFTRLEEKGEEASPTVDSAALDHTQGQTEVRDARKAPPAEQPTAPTLVSSTSFTPVFVNVFNGTLLFSYLLAASGLALRVLLDTVVSKLWQSSDASSEGLLFILSSVCFVLATPLAHYSARQLGMKVIDPFRGSGGYIALQVLGWGSYAVLLILKALAVVAWQNRDTLSGLHSFARTHEGYWFTMFGVLDMIPVALITLSNVVEAKREFSRLARRDEVQEAIEGVRSVMRNYACRCNNADERALARRAFRVIAAPAYDAYSLPRTRHCLELQSSPAPSDEEDCRWEKGSNDSTDSLVTAEETRVRHESVLVIVILMACFSAAFYVIAAFTWNIPIVSLSMASCGFAICVLSCITTHAGYGLVLNGGKGFKPFMPFRGGTEFMKLQIAGWTCFACVLLITLTSIVETVETSVPALLIAAVLSVAAQLLLLDSIPRFSLKEPSSYFLEHNSEVIVAVLCFVGALIFGNAYGAFKAFVTSTDTSATGTAGSPDDDRWMSTKRTRVPFVVAIIGITLAVPLVLMALGRTTRQAGLVAKKNRESSKERRRATNDEPEDNEEEALEGVQRTAGGEPLFSTTGRLSGYARWANKGVLWEAFSNLMQVLLMLTGAVLPFSVAFIIYSFSVSVSPRSQRGVESAIRWFGGVLAVSLVLSLVPYLLHVGVPRVFITLRFTVVTWVQYGIAFLIASCILVPAFAFPSMGTITSAVLLFALTLLGNFAKVRLLMRMMLSALIGYRVYTAYTAFRADGLWTALTPASVATFVVDIVGLVFWLAYIPTYEGKPYHTGRMRSERAIDFARRYIFSDVVRYFKFKIIVDDESVQLRDGKKQYLFSFHPHGVFPGTALFCAMTEEWQRKIGTNPHNHLSTHVASIIFNVPGVRDYNLRLGSVSVTRQSIEASLARGNSSVIVTGGQAEMLRTQLSDKQMTLVTHHMGFIRIAMRSKVPLVPLLSFAENNLLGLLQFPRIQKVTLKILGFPFPFVPYGRFGLPVPFRTPLTLVVGKPVPIPADADPDNPEDVKRVSELYFAELKDLFFRRRAEAGYPDMELVLVNEKEERRKAREAAERAKAEKQAKKQQ